MSTLSSSRRSEPVDRFPTGDRHQPPRRIRGYAAVFPGGCRAEERVLEGILGEIEVPQEPDQSGQHARPVEAVDEIESLVDRHRAINVVGRCRDYISATGRTSTEPNFADGTIAAHASAWSSSSQSIR